MSHNDEDQAGAQTFESGERPEPFKPDELNLEEEARLQAEGAGANVNRYKEYSVVCAPLDAVKPIEKFSDVIESKLLLKNIESLGYTQMTPIQQWAMPAIFEGHDIIGCAQTGSGKTAAFLLPILQTILKLDLDSNDPNGDCQHPYCLIISPTRELAKQIYTHAQMLSRDSKVKCQYMYGQVATYHLKSNLFKGCHLLVATPGRLKDFLQRGWISFKNIRYVILDEGDRLVDEGFTGDINHFFGHETMPPKENRQTLFFSATFKHEVQKSAREYLKESFLFLTIGRIGAANEDIKQEFIVVSRSEKKRELKRILKEVPEDDKTIVFTQTKSAADMLASFFSALKLSSTSIHGDRHQSQREQAIAAFKRGEKRFLISSPVGNRGLDLPKVALVINYDLPDNIDEYVHRIGRTGRAGNTGRAISFFDEQRDREILPDMIKILEEAKQEVPDWMKDPSLLATLASGDTSTASEGNGWIQSNGTSTGWGDAGGGQGDAGEGWGDAGGGWGDADKGRGDAGGGQGDAGGGWGDAGGGWGDAGGGQGDAGEGWGDAGGGRGDAGRGRGGAGRGRGGVGRGRGGAGGGWGGAGEGWGEAGGGWGDSGWDSKPARRPASHDWGDRDAKRGKISRGRGGRGRGSFSRGDDRSSRSDHAPQQADNKPQDNETKETSSDWGTGW